jgi:putative endonuclease
MAVTVQLRSGAQNLTSLLTGFLLCMQYFVYILFSEKLNKFYIGTTTNVERRLQEHNNDLYKTAFSPKGIPWTLFLSILCQSSKQAYNLERFIKKMKSSAFIRRLKAEPEIIPPYWKKINKVELVSRRLGNAGL